MEFDVVTIFPEQMTVAAGIGVIGKALESGKATLRCHNPRDFAADERGTVDDRPFGGGPGMVMTAEALALAIDHARGASQLPARVVYMSPQGAVLDQARVSALAEHGRLLLLCGRYEGIDERLVSHYVDEEVSIGDFVVSGGELPAAILMDALVRGIPGAIGKSASVSEDSFVEGLLDCPHYTRPESWRESEAPAVLLSGHHGRVRDWRKKQALGRTWLRRPDLLLDRRLDRREQAMLKEFIEDYLAGSLDQKD